MVQSTEQNARTTPHLAELEAEIRGAVANGVTLRELQELVSTIVAEGQNDNTQGDIPIYDELPAGLITLDQAAEQFGLNLGTLRVWVQRGRLQKRALLKYPARSGGNRDSRNRE